MTVLNTHMHISWLGQTCVKLQIKNVDEDVIIMLDAYRPKSGEFPRSFTPKIACFSHGDKECATLSQNPYIIDCFGEFEIKNCLIYSLPGGEGNMVFKIDAEDLTIVHLGKLNKFLENGDLEKILNPDVLFVPVGGEPNYLEIKQTVKLINSLEPRIIIPIGYKCDTEPDAKPLSAFISEMGIKPETTEKKIIIKKKDLPQEETRVMVLEKE